MSKARPNTAAMSLKERTQEFYVNPARDANFPRSVGGRGLEPLLLTERDSKPRAATNYATRPQSSLKHKRPAP